MNRIIIALALLLVVGSSVQAQTQNNNKEQPTQGKRWWYGAHIDFGFSAQNNLSFLTLGASPMAGYKVLPMLSVGPKAKFVYNNLRIRDVFNGVERLNSFNYGLGGFMRAHVFREFFAQLELGYESISHPLSTTPLSTQKYSGINSHIGVGYNSGAGNGGLAYEAMITYDLNLLAVPTFQQLNYRIGFTIYY